jgi:phosphatidylinositol 4-kinase type 2
MTMTEEYTQMRMRSPATSEPSAVVQGFNVNSTTVVEQEKSSSSPQVEALRALRISATSASSSSSNEKKKKSKNEEEDAMTLPMTPKKGSLMSADVEKDAEELMTPRSLSKRIGKPDIKVMLATGNNEPIDVMRGRGIVTSMTLRAKAEGIKRVPEKTFTTFGKSRFSNSNNNGRSNQDEDEDDEDKVNLVLPAEVLRNAAQKEKQSNENDTEVDNNTFDDPKEYRKLMVKLSDLSYIHIKAAVGVDNATGNVIERDFWLPLDETKTIGDLKRYVEEANTLETMKMMQNRNKMITNGTKNSTSPPKTTAMSNSKLAPVNEDEELESVVLYKGRELADSRRLMDENVTHNTTLHFYVKKDAQNVTVKMHGSRDVELNLKADETAESLRGKISALSSSLGARAGENGGQNQLDLFYGAKALKDGPLSSYGVRAGATLELRPHVPARQNVDGAMNIPRGMRNNRNNNSESRSYGSGYDSISRSINISNNSHHSGSSRNGSHQKSPRLSWGSYNGNNHQFGSSVDRFNQTHQQSGSYMRSHSLRSSNSTIDSVSPPEQPITPIGSFDMAREGLLAGVHPMLSSGGTGGAYFLKSTVGETVAVFKPADEEPLAKNNPRGNSWMNNHNNGNNTDTAIQSSPGEGMRKGTRVGEGAAREVAAYLLDHDGFSGVPVTSLANLSEQSVFFSGEDDDIIQRENENSGKLGSIQEFIKADAEAEEFGPSLFPLEEVHKIAVLDIRLANTDRNAGNILVKKDENTGQIVSLIPIDHGYALPHTFEDVCFEWEFWPQAKQPFSKSTKEYIETLDAEEDIEYLRDNDIELHSSSERVLKVSTMLLQKASKLDFPPADIAAIMSRSVPTRMSDVEKLVAKAASTAICACRSERGELVHKSPNNGSFWNDLDEEGENAESIFMREFERALDAYLAERER